MLHRQGMLLVGLVALAAFTCRSLLRAQARQRRAAAKSEPIQVWEGEGGGVPVNDGRMAAQVSPQA